MRKEMLLFLSLYAESVGEGKYQERDIDGKDHGGFDGDFVRHKCYE